jgi:hypothetical protein
MRVGGETASDWMMNDVRREKGQKEETRDLTASRHDRIDHVLNRGIEHKYTVMLQDLFHSYTTSNEDVKKEMEASPWRCHLTQLLNHR